MTDSYKLFFFQLISHIALVFQLIYGNYIDWIISISVYFITGCFGMTMTYHRLLSHKSWNAPKWFTYFGTLCGFWGLTGSSLAWVAVHREHHRFTDTEKDPHTPLYKNPFYVQYLSMFDKANIRYVPDLLRDKFHLFLHKHYFLIHLLIIVITFLINPQIMMSAYLVPAAILWNAGSAINTINHLYGYKNFDISDNSKNNVVTGFLVWGEGWHNNHHNSPKSYTFKNKWWEFDIGAFFIALLDTQCRQLRQD